VSVQRVALTGIIARPVSPADRRHLQHHLVPPHPPDDDEKYGYIQRNLPYLTTILVIGSGCLIVSQVRFEVHNPSLWPFMIFTATYVIYQVISLPVNFTGRGFDLGAHQARIRAWQPLSYPSVDIHLPICGEPIEVLHNTWQAVADLVAGYAGVARPYVLDDGPSDDARSLAESHGFAVVRAFVGHGVGDTFHMAPQVPHYFDPSLSTMIEPGTTFTYGGIPLQIFGALLTRKLATQKLTPHEYLRERLLQPAGVLVESWRILKDGTSPLPTGAFLSAENWLAYGRYIDEHRSEFAECFVGSSANPRYGLGWWLQVKGMPADLCYASGSGGQALYVVPSSKLMVVHFGRGRGYDHGAFLRRLFAVPSSRKA